MKDKTLKVLFIIIGCIPFVWLLIHTFIDEYGNPFYVCLLDTVINLLFYPWVLIGLVFIIIGVLIPSEKKKDREAVYGVKAKKKNTIWKVLLVVGIIPFAAPIVTLAIGLITGGSSNEIGDFFLFWAYLFGPTFVIGGVLIALSVYKLKKSN